jgi:hypothetical protein
MKHKTPPKIELPPTPRTQAAFDLRHTKTCSIGYFKEVMEAMERDLIAAEQALDELRYQGAKVPSSQGTKVTRPPAEPQEDASPAAGDGE